MSLIAELKRRNVFKVGAAYLALAWVVVQATGAIVPALNLPATLVPTVVWIGVIGFPCVLIFAWAYELTPEGLKRESEVDRSQSITHVNSKRLDYIIIGMLAVAIGLFLLQYFRPTAAPPVATSEAIVASAVPAADVAPPVPTAPALEPAAVAPNDKSIAVLPFADMSQAKDQQYFSDGMSEELLNLLAKVSDLKVIARTSSFAFKGKDVPIAEIARQLNVAHVLEGSVRKAGNTVRITAQLIRTADSTHLWSETYDRPLDDIFKVQDEIAGAIAQALQIKLAGGKLSRREGGTQNLEAYQLYLRGLSAIYKDSLSESFKSGERFLQQATELDPNFGLAWSSLAWAAMMQADAGFLDMTVGYEQARQHALHALQLSPELAPAHAALQWVSRVYDRDWAAAANQGRLALSIDSSDMLTLNGAGYLALTLGRWQEAENLFRSALIRDPLNPYLHMNLGTCLFLSGRLTAAEEVYRNLLEIEPDFLWTRDYLGRLLVVMNRPDEAVEIAAQISDESLRLSTFSIVLYAAGRKTEADEALNEVITNWSHNSAYGIAIAYATRSDNDRAIEWLERAYEQRDPGLPELLGQPAFKGMANDPRFIAFLQKMNLPTEPVPVNWQ